MQQSFHALSQKQGETVQQFATWLRQAARDCAFGADMDNQIRDAVVARCSYTSVHCKLLEEGHDLTLARALEVALLCERIEEQMSRKTGEEAKSAKKEHVNRISQKNNKAKLSGLKNQQKSKSEQSYYTCGNTDHFGKDPKCLAFSWTCHKCYGKDHFSKVCRTKKLNKQTISNVEEQTYYAFLVKDDSVQNRLNVCLGGVDVKMLIDSGATCNIVSSVRLS